MNAKSRWPDEQADLSAYQEVSEHTRKFSRLSHGHNLAFTKSVSISLNSFRTAQLTHVRLLPAVVLLNVMSFYSPIRDLVRNGIKMGFIQPSNENLLVFVDGPSDPSEHESFNWGEAALKALDSWVLGETSVHEYDWTKRLEGERERKGDRLECA